MATRNWTATSSGQFTTASNWDRAPLRGDDVIIAPASSLSVTYAGGSNPLVLSSLTISNAQPGATTSFVMSSGALAVRNGYIIVGILSQTGGNLTLRGGGAGASIVGTLQQSGGTLTFSNGGTISNSTAANLTQTGGTMIVANGIFSDVETISNFAGTIAGGGILNLAGGNTSSVYFNSGINLTIASLMVSNTNLNLNTSVSYGGRLQLGGVATLSLNNRVFTSTGTAAVATLFGQVTNGGTLVLGGRSTLNGLNITNGSSVSITGTASQTGAVALGLSGSGTLDVAAGGVLRLTGNHTINFGSSGLLTNEGTIVKTGGSPAVGASVIVAPIYSTGVIDTGTGIIDFVSAAGSGAVPASTISGTLTGAGTAIFAQGVVNFGGSVSLTVSRLEFTGAVGSTIASFSTAPLSYAGQWVQLGGLLYFGAQTQLSGPVVWDGGQIKGTASVLIGAATATAMHLGSGMDLEGNMTFRFGNSPTSINYAAGLPTTNVNITQSGQIVIGGLTDSVDQVYLGHGSTWLLQGAAGISGNFGTIVNSGLFEKASGSGTATISSVFTNGDALGTTTLAGTIAVDSGVLRMAGSGTLGGVVQGLGVLDIGGAYTLSGSLSLNVANVVIDGAGVTSLAGTIAYGNSWSNEGGIVQLRSIPGSGANSLLTLSGTTSLLSGAFSGNGVVVASGTTRIGVFGGSAFQLAQGADLTISGQAEQAGFLQMTSGSSAPTLAIAQGGTYTMDSGVTIGGASNQVVGTVTVAGLLKATQAGTTAIASALVNTGTIQVQTGEMQFLGPVSGSGSFVVSGAGTLDLLNSNGGQPTLSFGAGGGVVELQYPNAFAGTFANFGAGDVIELMGFSYPTATNFVLSGNGKVLTVTGGAGNSASFTFGVALKASDLLLGVGPHGGLSILHV